MKKIILLIILALPIFIACNKEVKYEINGTVIGDLEGNTVYLKKMEMMQPVKNIDSAIITNGKFTLSAALDTLDMYLILVNNNDAMLPLFVDGSTDKTIEIKIDKLNPDNSEIKNSPLYELYKNYGKGYVEVQQAIQNVFMRINEAEQNGEMTEELGQELNREYEKAKNGIKQYQIDFIKNNPNTVVSAFVLNIIQGLTPEEIEAQLSNFSGEFTKSPLIASQQTFINIIKSTQEGQKYTDVRLPDPNGKEIALSDYVGKGKYVLIDFWASWCGPCRQENPNVVALYEKYKDKGFEIVGISLDKDKDSWVKAIEKDGITWPQMSDLKYWQSEGARLYNIRSIPATILLDKEGIIIAKNLRGQELEDKVAELLSGI